MERLEQFFAPSGVEATPSAHDLQQLAAEIRQTYFSSASAVPIRWGKQPANRRRRRSIRLGSYDHAAVLIRIHPSLNAPHVPAYFIQSIIHHEYLHHVLGPAHNARFHRHERQFRHHREAREWLKANLPVLLGRKKPARLRMPAGGVRPIAARAVRMIPSTPRPVQLSLF